jgi:hypothetical protein
VRPSARFCPVCGAAVPGPDDGGGDHPPAPPRRAGRAGGAWLIALVLVVLAAGGYLVASRSAGTARQGDGAQSAATAPATDRAAGTAVASPRAPSVGSAPSAAAPAVDPVAFVRTYYALLPDDTADAWPLLSPAAQAASGGRDGFTHFYSEISSVSLESVQLVGENTVEALVVFDRTDGRTSREPYRFVVSFTASGPVIDSFTRL